MNGETSRLVRQGAGKRRKQGSLAILSAFVFLATGCSLETPTGPPPASAGRGGAICGEIDLDWPGASAAAVVLSVYADVDSWAADRPLVQQTMQWVEARVRFRLDGLPGGAYALDAWADVGGDGAFDPEDAFGVYGSASWRHPAPAAIRVSETGDPSRARLVLKPWREVRGGSVAVPAEHLPAEPEPMADCKTWGCIKCQFNPRCGKGDG